MAHRRNILAAQGQAVPYKLILLDYSMPDMDGPQTAIEILDKAREVQVPLPYICCLTAYTENEFR